MVVQAVTSKHGETCRSKVMADPKDGVGSPDCDIDRQMKEDRQNLIPERRRDKRRRLRLIVVGSLLIAIGVLLAVWLGTGSAR